VTAPPDPLARLVGVFLDHLKAERGLSANTIAAYSRDLAAYRDYLGARGVTAADQIDQGLVAGFAVAAAQRGLAPASVGRMTVAVRALHRFWAQEALTADNPADRVNPARVPSRLPQALTVEQVSDLIAAAGADRPGATAEQLCDRALVEVLYGTGARVSEALGLDVDDAARLLADDQAGLRLLGKGGKQRVVPVGSYARAGVEAWLVRGRPTLAQRDTPALFLNARGTRLSRQSAFNRIEALGARAGLVGVSPHTLRHSYATHLIDGGADIRVVQELLGHSSVVTTQVYTLVTVEHLREVYRASHPRAL
jgi:integrase/recombinase XerD